MRRCLKCWLVASSCLALLAPQMAEAQGSSQYLPMFEQAKWVLRNPRQASAVEFEIPHRDGDGYRFVSRNPWGTSEWTLVDQEGAFAMTQYGAQGRTMPLAERPVWVDFNRPARSRWNNMLGTLEISSRSVTVKTASNTYSDCVQLRHTPKGGSALIYTFAPGVGFVQFGEGSNAFVLDEGSSNLLGGRTSSSRPAAPVPSRGTSASKTARRGVGGVLIGLTPNRLATEPNVPENLIKRYNQTVDLGVSFVVGNSTWKELEPRSGQYSLDSLNYLISSTAPYELPLSYTLRIIDTIHKNVPDDLQRVAWNHPRMKERVERLIETLAPVIRGHVRWFMFGYEVDGYMQQHPREAAAFAELYQVAAARLKHLIPDIQVSTTVTYMNIDQLDGRLAPLNRQLDFLALTYSPLQPGWTVEDPSMLPRHFETMKRVAGARKIVLQEIAYPTSPLTRGSPEKQATFYELAFREFAKGDGAFAAANFMMLADLSDEDADGYTSFYGMKGQSTFRAVLQTLGLHDVNGRPKPALRVLEKYLQKDAR